MKEKINIVTCLDRGYVMPTSVMMYSICVNNPNVDFSFYIVSDDSVTQNDKKVIVDNLSIFDNHVIIYFYAANITCNKFPSTDNRQGLTNATYYRLFIADILPNTIEKVIYLDGDLIVRHSLMPLWQIDITNKGVAAVFDSVGEDNNYEQRLNYPSKAGYFNAGVMLLNLSYWRKNHISKKVMDLIQDERFVFSFHDQDILNLLFWNNKKILPVKYNMNSGFMYGSFYCNNMKKKKDIDDAIKDPVIVHFSGFYRPWEAYIRFPHPFSDTFYKYQKMTKWEGCRIENRSTILKIKNTIADFLCYMNIRNRTELYNTEIKPID